MAQSKVALFDSSFTEYPGTIEQFDVIAPPTLTIEEQPAQFYRFRYECEIQKDSSKIGGLLPGRSSTDGNKSFMKIRVRDIDPALHSQLQLTVCTVSAEDKAPHPYYLHGDNCEKGYFELKKSVESHFKGSEWDFTFNRLAVICVPKKSQKEVDGAMDLRLKNVPDLPDYIEKSAVKYDSRNLGSIRLAFSLQFTDTSGQSWSLPTVYSDAISAEKQKKSISVDCLNPVEVPKNGGSLVAILTKTPTTGISKAEVRVELRTSATSCNQSAAKAESLTENDKGAAPPSFVFQCSLVEMKKHLLIVKTPDMTSIIRNDRLKCRLTIYSNSFASEELEIVFSGNDLSRSSGGAQNPLKRPYQN